MSWQSSPKRKKKSIILSYLLLGIICFVSIHLWLLFTHDALASIAGIKPITLFLKTSKDGSNNLLLSEHDVDGGEGGKQKKSSSANNKCNIPTIDPWHRDVAPFIDFKWRHKKCRIVRKASVERGILKINLKYVQSAGYYYVHRKDEDTNRYSKWHSLRDSTKEILENEAPICLHVSGRERMLVSAMTPDSEFFAFDSNTTNATTPRSVALVASDRLEECDALTQMVLKKDHRIVHLTSKRCVYPRAAEDQQNHPLILLPNKDPRCHSDNAKFNFTSDGKIVHLNSRLCAHLNVCGEKKNQGFFDLNDCDQNATRLHYNGGDRDFEDLNMRIPLEDDIVRFDYIQSNMMSTEYFIYPKYNNNKNNKKSERKSNPKLKNRASQNPNRLNLMYIMIDSISRASAQRYLNATYKALDRDPNTVIMKGHTIVGDGTTAQLLAILLGKQEKDLPEARRGHKHSKPVDTWPWIWKEYQDVGYETFFGEDDAEIGTFNYRLKGFKEQPTTKYLRPWYIEIDQIIRRSKQISTDCAHKLTFQYLKDVFYEYRKERKFIFHASNLGHNNPAQATSMDKDLISFMGHLNSTSDLDETAVIIFGDHGDRTAAFRKTMQGKLEERLPFVSITLPPWFRHKFTKEFNNLKRNAEILTSHYDLYATAKHILTLPNVLPGTPQHRYGKSLFTDISSFNRKCKDAGVAEMWCPCVNYRTVDKKNPDAIKMAHQVVAKINEYLKENPVVAKRCEQLQLKEILRVREVTTSEQVEHFVETVKNEDCDDCGIRLNRTIGYTHKKYELLIEVRPSDGQYELLVDYNHINGTISEVGVDQETRKHAGSGVEEFMQKVSRINKYGDQPKCVARQYPYHRAFCFCKGSARRGMGKGNKAEPKVQ